MDQTKLDKITAELTAAVDVAGNVAGMLLPGQAAYIAIGKALAVLAPQLYNDAVLLFQGSPPTPEEVAGLAGDIHALLNPETV